LLRELQLHSAPVPAADFIHGIGDLPEGAKSNGLQQLFEDVPTFPRHILMSLERRLRPTLMPLNIGAPLWPIA
jgi:hypothetical protein